MTPRGKRGKLKKPKRVFHSFHRAWKSGKRRPDFHISTAPAAGSHSTRRKKDAAETEFHLTIPVTSITMISPASLRSDRDRHRVGISARDQIGITDHLHRNQHTNTSPGLFIISQRTDVLAAVEGVLLIWSASEA